MTEGGHEQRLRGLDAAFREATEQRRHGRIEEAEAGFRDLVDQYAELGSVERQAMVRINLAQLLQQRGALQEAVREYERALALAESIDDRRRVGLCHGGLASIAMERGEYDRCEALIQQAVRVFEADGDRVGLGNQYGNLGLLRQTQGRLEEAVGLFGEAAHHFVEAGYGPGAVGVLQCIGEIHRRQGEFEEAELAHRQALDLATRAGLDVAQAHSHRAIGQLRRLQGDLLKARQEIERGLQIHRRLGDVRGYLAALIDLSTVEFAQGKGGDAIDHLTECADRADELGLITPLVKALLNRALYRLDTEQIDAVEADLARARTLLDQTGEPLGSIIWAVTSARVLVRRARWDEAAEVLETEMERASSANLAPVRPAILGLLGSIEVLRGDTRKALELFEESEAHYRNLGDVEGIRMAVVAKLRLLGETGRFDETVSALESVLAATRESTLPQPLMEAEILSVLAGVHDLAEDFEAARGAASEARRLYHEGGFELAGVGAGLLYHQAGTDASRAGFEPPAEDAVEDLHALNRKADALESPTTTVVARCTLADALAARGRQSEARAHAEEALKMARDLSFEDGVARALQVLARTDSDRAKAVEAYHIWCSLESSARAERLVREWNLTPVETQRASAIDPS